MYMSLNPRQWNKMKYSLGLLEKWILLTPSVLKLFSPKLPAAMLGPWNLRLLEIESKAELINTEEEKSSDHVVWALHEATLEARVISEPFSLNSNGFNLSFCITCNIKNFKQYLQ